MYDFFVTLYAYISSRNLLGKVKVFNFVQNQFKYNIKVLRMEPRST